MSASKNRVDAQAAFILHAYPYRETSLIVEAFSQNFGRVALVARGARRGRSALRGTLMAFQPLELGWFGQGEMHTLAKAEWQGGLPLPRDQALLIGYYLNELLLRLLPREDPHPALFDAYHEMLAHLAAGVVVEGELRRFEYILLRELGYAPTLDKLADGSPVLADHRYAYQIERGPVVLGETDGAALNSPAFSGKTLLAIMREDYNEAETLKQSKALMRLLIDHYLDGKALNSRRVYKELLEL